MIIAYGVDGYRHIRPSLLKLIHILDVKMGIFVYKITAVYGKRERERKKNRIIIVAVGAFMFLFTHLPGSCV